MQPRAGENYHNRPKECVGRFTIRLPPLNFELLHVIPGSLVVLGQISHPLMALVV